MHLSRRNGWINNRGEIYLVFSQNKLATKLSKSKASVNNYMSELKNFGLIDMVYQKSKEKGNLPVLIYIKKLPMLTDEEVMELKDEILIDTKLYQRFSSFRELSTARICPPVRILTTSVNILTLIILNIIILIIFRLRDEVVSLF